MESGSNPNRLPAHMQMRSVMLASGIRRHQEPPYLENALVCNSSTIMATVLVLTDEVVQVKLSLHRTR